MRTQWFVAALGAVTVACSGPSSPPPSNAPAVPAEPPPAPPEPLSGRGLTVRYGEFTALDDRSPRVLYKLALASYRSGGAEQAIEALRQALLIDERFPEAHYLLGMCLRDRAQDDDLALIGPAAGRHGARWSGGHVGHRGCDR